MSTMIRPAVAVLIAAVWLGGCAALSTTGAGKREYNAACAGCHGASGRGNGPEAAGLAVRPADLTLLAQHNGGAFPAAYVRQVIDGRAQVAGHGSRDMPVWGIRFQVIPRSAPEGPAEEPFGFREDTVRTRIEALTAYLRQLQAK